MCKYISQQKRQYKVLSKNKNKKKTKKKKHRIGCACLLEIKALQFFLCANSFFFRNADASWGVFFVSNLYTKLWYNSQRVLGTYANVFEIPNSYDILLR